MDNDSNKINDEEIENLNVRCVIGALAFLQTDATESELVSCFTTTNDEPQNVVQEEIKRILDNGVISGLIVRNEDKYALPNREQEYQIDGDDSDIEYIDPNHSHYEVLSSPSAREAGAAYKRVRSRSRSPAPKPKKRKYAKQVPQPTDRLTRSQSRESSWGRRSSHSRGASHSRGSSHSRGASQRRSAGPPNKKSKKEPQPPTRFSSRTAQKSGGRGRGR